MEKTNKKIWGIYNTFNKKPEELNEIDVWINITTIGSILTTAKIMTGLPPETRNFSEQDLINAQYNIDYLIYYTRNFGVEFSREPSEDERVEISKSFNSWYQFWSNHFNSMGAECYKQFVDAKNSGRDISKYMPTKSWKDSLKSQQR